MRGVFRAWYHFVLWRRPLLQQLLVLFAFCISCLLNPAWTNAQNEAPAKPRVNPGAQAEKYTSALLVEAETGKVLYEKDPHLPLPPTSMVKMMTALIVMEKVRDGAIKLSDLVTVSRWASKMGGSQVFL